MNRCEWVNFGDTSILLEQKTEHLVSEWQPVAQVTRRQVYEHIPPQWYAWIGGAPNGPTHTMLGHFPTHQDAVKAVVRQLAK